MNTERRPGSRRIALAVAVAGGLALAAGGVWLALSARPFTVAVVGLSDAELEAYSVLFPAGHRVIRIAAAEAGAERLGALRADCVLAWRGLPASALSVRAQPVPSALLDAVPPSLNAGLRRDDGTVAGMPLQLDHFSLSWDAERFASLGLPEPGSRAALESALAAYDDPVGPAMLFAGGDDETLLSVLSALCLSSLGAAGYDRAAEALAGEASFDAAMDRPIGAYADGREASLRSAAREIIAWRDAGRLHPDWWNLTESDVKAFLEKGYGFAVLGTLAFRRSVDYQSIYRFKTLRFPGAGDSMLAPVLALYLSPRASMKDEASAVLAAASDPETAYSLATATGRATALSAARAPDVQAADLLSWAAGSGSLRNGLYRDAFSEPLEAAAFAAALRDWLRSGD